MGSGRSQVFTFLDIWWDIARASPCQAGSVFSQNWLVFCFQFVWVGRVFSFLGIPNTFTFLWSTNIFTFLWWSKVFSFLESDARFVLGSDFCSKNKMGWVRPAFYSWNWNWRKKEADDDDSGGDEDGDDYCVDDDNDGWLLPQEQNALGLVRFLLLKLSSKDDDDDGKSVQNSTDEYLSTKNSSKSMYLATFFNSRQNCLNSPELNQVAEYHI